MARTKQEQVAKVKEWMKANTESLLIQPRKELDLKHRIDEAVKAGKGTSRQSYIIAAVLHQLEQDGIEAPKHLGEQNEQAEQLPTD